ncbi:PKIP [Urbanus proteus nucleopolyhedrovirus]|uniref:PKIP n=1 Tax=Urbanus proteus nucleopolyhedrovirus TaxID=1675866 RepID=A0A162GU56_9ABAC|nr:PKIP [Urbanus proteus nucleopolyhedrovirus]AKR17324.1 PKIP [Urbanus proteus nucleopolyhedrovirus]
MSNEAINIIESLHQKITTLDEEYKKRVMAFFKNTKKSNSLALQNELYTLYAKKYSLEIQLLNVEKYLNANKMEQINFINSMVELNTPPFVIDQCYENSECDYFLNKYNYDVFNDSLQQAINNNLKRFKSVLIQFIDKRNSYRKKQKDYVLTELVLLKCTLIKHIYFIEKLVEINKQ